MRKVKTAAGIRQKLEKVETAAGIRQKTEKNENGRRHPSTKMEKVKTAAGIRQKLNKCENGRRHPSFFDLGYVLWAFGPGAKRLIFGPWSEATYFRKIFPRKSRLKSCKKVSTFFYVT